MFSSNYGFLSYHYKGGYMLLGHIYMIKYMKSYGYLAVNANALRDTRYVPNLVK